MARGPFRIEVPYHMGLEAVGVGKGPRLLIESGADQLLACRGMPAEVEHVRLWNYSSRDLDAVVDVNRQIRSAVRRACDEQVLPVVLAGNCNSCLGTLAGLEPALTGVVWMDAHPDFHTPQTTRSGSLEGMALAIAVGDCHEDLRVRIGFSQPVAPRNVCLPVCFDIEDGERARLEASEVSDEFPRNVEVVYLHLDVDFLTGMDLERACAMVRSVAVELPLAAVGVTNYNPGLDRGGEALGAALQLLRQLP